MSNNWYSSSWTGGASGNNSSCYNDYNQREVYEYGGENFSIGNNVGNFIGYREGFNLGYGATQNNSNFRRNCETRYGDGAFSDNTESYYEHFGGVYEERYGDNGSSNNRSNCRGNYEQRYENVRSNERLSSGENYVQRYGENPMQKDRLNYKQRYGDARSNGRSSSRENYEQRYGENLRSNNSLNHPQRSSYRENYEQRYGEDPRSNDSSNCRGNYEQRYGENAARNDCANYFNNFSECSKPSFGDNVQGGHCEINYTGNDRETYNGNERRTDSDWTGHYYSGDRGSGSDGRIKVEESCSSKKSIQDCLLEGSIVVVKQQRGRPKYKCLHCKITFFNERHIEKKGHLGHVEHCLDVRACFEATVGKRGFGLNFKKLSSHTSEGLNSEKVKTEPYQNEYEDYNEKDIKKESETIKQEVKDESFERDGTGGGFKVNNLEAMSTKEKGNVKVDVDKKKELKEKKKEEKKKKKEKKKEEKKKKKEKKKKLMKLKRAKARERNEEKDKAIFDKEVSAVTRLDQYACLKPECLQTFQVWGDARRHMKQGCLPVTKIKKGKKSFKKFIVKPNMGQSREKAQNQREMGTPMTKRVADENEEKLIEAARNFYTEKRNASMYPNPKHVAWHLRQIYGGFGLHPARIHQIVKSIIKP